MNHEPAFYTTDRLRMVDEQLAARDIYDERVLDAMRTVPRHLFVPDTHQHMAYGDGPLPLAEGQTISQPYIVGLMTQLLRLQGGEKVLEIGTGSGYQAAVLGQLAAQVYTVERHAALAAQAASMLHALHYDNVQVLEGDGSLGWPEFAPYDAILVTAAAPEIYQDMLNQLGDGGRLISPVGGRRQQVLVRWYRRAHVFHSEQIIPVAFVPLRGEKGWGENEWKRWQENWR